MVDFSLNEQQQAHVQWVRELMDAYVRPAALELDKIADPDERFPWG